MLERASPAELRKSLEIANLFVKNGIRFVCMPCADDTDFVGLTQEAVIKLERMEAASPTAEGETK